MVMRDEIALAELAPLERALEAELWGQVAHFSGFEALDAVLTAMPVPVMVLNRFRQIVYANQAMADLIGAEDRTALIGSRTGEALRCTHALESAGGCGTTAFCRYCGAARAISQSEARVASVEECRILSDLLESPTALDLRVTARPFSAAGDMFTVFTITDISDEKRRHALERIFFHDILNTVQKMRIAADLLEEESGAEADMLRRVIQKAVQRLTDEIQAQRDLTDMENDELTVKPAEVDARRLLQDLIESYLDHGLAGDHKLRLDAGNDDVFFIADQTKLRRVIDNMVKNALEAEKPGATVTVGYYLTNGTSDTEVSTERMVEFRVHNPSVMTEAVRRQIFQRSFSTKGKGRGLGTYSMKMLAERYLEGQIIFTSEPDEGTTFRARFPVMPGYAQEQAGE